MTDTKMVSMRCFSLVVVSDNLQLSVVDKVGKFSLGFNTKLDVFFTFISCHKCKRDALSLL